MVTLKPKHVLALVCIVVCIVRQVGGQVLTSTQKEENARARREQGVLMKIREDVAAMVQQVREETVIPAMASYNTQLYKLTENLTRISNFLTNLSSEVEDLQQDMQNRSVALTCPDQNWILYERKCYFFNTDMASWSAAKDGCFDLDGKLAESQTRSINDFLKVEARLRGGSYWIGGHDILQENRWEWNSNGASFVYQDWGPDQPNNVRSGQDCLELLEKFQWQWNDRECSIQQSYICETEALYRLT
ncbi:perlucin-like protein [Argopecten irradians]|uniref:perlucin-like protein n=1 Tax=Argopecten irradians TaxID=31199 RepID=UPI0037157DFF